MMVEPILSGLVGLGTIVGAILFHLAQRARRVRSWREAAKAAGLVQIEAKGSKRLYGHAGELEVRLEECHLQNYRGTRIVVGGLGYGLAFRRESVGTALEKNVLGRSDIELGDAEFDRSLYIQGAPELACALFDAETRRLVLDLMELKGSPVLVLADAELRLELPERDRWPESGRWHLRLRQALPMTIALAQRLRCPDDVAARLAANASGEPLATVRLRNLRALFESLPHRETTHRALQGALADDDVEIRLWAAIALGDEGRPALLQLAADGRMVDAWSARAVEALGPHLALARAKELLAEARRHNRRATARACLESVGRHAEPEDEPFLLAALEWATDDAPAAMAEALGRVGTVAAVMPLRSAAERIGDDRFRRAARQAIATIQSRQPGASPGQISLAAGEAGQVSVVDEDTRGRVSLPDEAKGS
jgi:hypothetical protein